ncbi:hypothetical protein MG293_010392 [Ovis ammon polii]|uniref:Uncharacterized protein n=1 Tax=Ovis ammon polii TaxID=230172 RepID=A0AAD4YAC7_OVIAM|nr:hypothetical protein MG293_010392 [Ovis ammon polii]
MGTLGSVGGVTPWAGAANLRGPAAAANEPIVKYLALAHQSHGSLLCAKHQAELSHSQHGGGGAGACPPH